MSKIQDCGKDGCVIDRLTIKLTIKEEKTAKLYGDALVWTVVFIDWLEWIQYIISVDVCPKSYISRLKISWAITL